MSTATLNPNSLRDNILRLAQQKDPYPFLTMVGDYLLQAPNDDAIRAMAIRSLFEKGLISVAAELASACPAEGTQGRELRAAANRLAELPTEIMAQVELIPRYRANLDTLRARGTEGHALADTIEEAWSGFGDSVTFHRSNDGNLLARGSRSDGQRIWLPAALDFVNSLEAAPDMNAFQNQLLPPLLFAGTGLGWLIERTWRATHHLYLSYSPAIFVVETNLRALAMVFHLHDWTQMLADERVHVFGGAEALDPWRTFVLEEEGYALPPAATTKLVLWPGQEPIPIDETVRAAKSERDRHDLVRWQRMNAIYASRDSGYWADRYAAAGANDPLRVLCVTTRFSTFLQHSMNDTIEALEALSCQTRLLIEESDHQVISLKRTHELIEAFQPDMVIVIDHHRHEFGMRFPQNIPFVCWIQDQLVHLFSPETGTRLGSLDFTIGYGREKCVSQCGYSEENFMNCGMAINPRKFRPPASTRSDEAPLCHAMYVSHHSETPEELHQRIRARTNGDDVLRFIDAFHEESRMLLRSESFHAACDLDALVATVEERIGWKIIHEDLRREIIDLYVKPLVDRTLRHVTLEWAADWADASGRSLHLYGHGWDRHPRFARYHRGVAGHGNHLAELLRRASIHLHMGLVPALHQRVLETVAAGGFALIRRNPTDFHQPVHDTFGAWLRHFDRQVPAQIPLEKLPADYTETYRELCAQCGVTPRPYLEITEELLLRWQRYGRQGRELNYANLLFPRFDEIVFQGPQDLAERAEFFITHPDERKAIAGDMRQRVESHFTYDAVMRDTLGFISNALRDQQDRQKSGGMAGSMT